MNELCIEMEWYRHGCRLKVRLNQPCQSVSHLVEVPRFGREQLGLSLSRGAPLCSHLVVVPHFGGEQFGLSFSRCAPLLARAIWAPI